MILIDMEHTVSPSTDVMDLVQAVNLHSNGKVCSVSSVKQEV